MPIPPALMTGARIHYTPSKPLECSVMEAIGQAEIEKYHLARHISITKERERCDQERMGQLRSTGSAEQCISDSGTTTKHAARDMLLEQLGYGTFLGQNVMGGFIIVVKGESGSCCARKFIENVIECTNRTYLGGGHVLIWNGCNGQHSY